jgi:hypothetical protein
MTADWSLLSAELARWRAERLALPLWWRDDDATEPTEALDRLADMSADLGLPVHLAVIPEPAQPALAALCLQRPELIPMVHGWQHRNRAPEGQKKAEFGLARPDARTEAAQAMDRMRALFGDRMVPVFVPPWNRIDGALLPELPALGYSGVSSFLPRPARLAAPGLVQINTHIDPIFWRGGRGLVPPGDLIAQITTLLAERRAGTTDATEPLGFLTHHLVHDADIWRFTRDCLATLLDAGATPINLLTLKDDLP